MANQLEVDMSRHTKKLLMVTLRIPKEGNRQDAQVFLEPVDGSGLAVAVFGPDSPVARADAARMMHLWNDSLEIAKEGKEKV